MCYFVFELDGECKIKTLMIKEICFCCKQIVSPSYPSANVASINVWFLVILHSSSSSNTNSAKLLGFIFILPSFKTGNFYLYTLQGNLLFSTFILGVVFIDYVIFKVVKDFHHNCLRILLKVVQSKTRTWANAQRDGRPAKHRWRPLFNAAKFG